MSYTHIRNVDLNLLVIAAALYKHRNVSKAAQELGLSQSAVSHALNRLRDQMDDPFFVRTSKGIAPTEYARRIQNELLDIVNRTDMLIRRQSSFNPLTAEGRLVFATTDFFEIVVMARLAPVLAKGAPKLQISLRPTNGSLPKQELEEGSTDIAIAGFYEDLPEGFYQTKIFTDHFDCAVGQRHPLAHSPKISLDEYFSARHALITLQGDFREKSATRGSRKREIAYGSSSFTGMAWILQSTELLLTAPSLLIKEYSKFFPLRVWRSPVDRGQLNMRMVWHAQTHEDPLRLYVRAQIKKICADF